MKHIVLLGLLFFVGCEQENRATSITEDIEHAKESCYKQNGRRGWVYLRKDMRFLVNTPIYVTCSDGTVLVYHPMTHEVTK